MLYQNEISASQEYLIKDFWIESEAKPWTTELAGRWT